MSCKVISFQLSLRMGFKMFGKGKTYAESTPTVRRRAALLKVQKGGGAAAVAAAAALQAEQARWQSV